MSINLTILDNGLRVVSDKRPGLETASVGVWIGVGARFEDQARNGISHLLEHMAFKGTKRRTAQSIAEEIEAVGGHMNAETSRESTAYYAKVLKDDLGLALDIIADIVQNATMAADELTREQEVIVQEILEARDTPDDVVFDQFQHTAFPDQPLGRPILGCEDIVRGLNADDLFGFMETHYRPKNMILAAAGNIDHDQLVTLATRQFGNLPPGQPATFEPAAYRGGESREKRDLEQAQVILGFPGISYFDEDFYPSAALSTLYGGGMSSRLFQEIREKRGLAYSISSFTSSYSDGGLFGVYAGTGAKEVADLIPLVCEESKKVVADVSEEEVARARAQLKANLLMSMESTSNRCSQIARQTQIYGRPLEMSEIIERVEAITCEKVQGIAERIFSGAPTLSVLGAIDAAESLEQVRERLIA